MAHILLRFPHETTHSAPKRKVRLNFLTNSFVSISKAIMDKVQGQLCKGFKREMWSDEAMVTSERDTLYLE